MCCAASSVPLFFRYAVMPVARKVWFPILFLMPVNDRKFHNRHDRDRLQIPPFVVAVTPHLVSVTITEA
jgi:hypothetical protein